jgi:hypothetical protein
VVFVSVRNKPLVGVTKFKVVKPQLISWGLWWFCFLAWTRSQVASGLWIGYVGGAVWYTTGLWKRVLYLESQIRWVPPKSIISCFP